MGDRERIRDSLFGAIVLPRNRARELSASRSSTYLLLTLPLSLLCVTSQSALPTLLIGLVSVRKVLCACCCSITNQAALRRPIWLRKLPQRLTDKPQRHSCCASSSNKAHFIGSSPPLYCLFTVVTDYRRLDEFDPTLPRLPTNVQIYTWQSCSLRELCQLLLSAVPSLLPQPYTGSRIAFRLVFPDIQAANRPGAVGRYISRDIGSVIIGANAEIKDTEMEGGDASTVAEALKQLDGDPDKTLSDVKFLIGDYVACAILPPLPDGGVPAAPPSLSGAGRGPGPGAYGGRGRENGFSGRGDYGFGRGGRGGRFDDRRPSGGVPSGEWRRGDALPEREHGYGRGGRGRSGGDGDRRDRGRGRGRW